MTMRVLLTLSDDVEAIVVDLARLREISIPRIFLQSLSTEKYLDDLLRSGKRRLLYEDEDGALKELVIQGLEHLPSLDSRPVRWWQWWRR